MLVCKQNSFFSARPYSAALLGPFSWDTNKTWNISHLPEQACLLSSTQLNSTLYKAKDRCKYGYCCMLVAAPFLQPVRQIRAFVQPIVESQMLLLDCVWHDGTQLVRSFLSSKEYAWQRVYYCWRSLLPFIKHWMLLLNAMHDASPWLCCW